ncbi:MAG TPA: type IV pilus twitching motility protein PilT [Elusimicrobiota bacterium]|nr:type IV pilus twitching motility protein PilT [Elusimicrobiota bacterium]
MLNINELLTLMVQKKASDMHFTVGAPPVLRVDGEIVRTNYDVLTPELCQKLIYSLLTDKQKERFERESELDLSFGIKGVGRIRMNVYRQRGSVAAAFRAIPSRFMSFEELGLPAAIHELLKINNGLFLVTGPTGAGKSTTLASMIDFINEHRACHIITIEDPIEYLHFHKRAIVNQREVDYDTKSFSTALKYVLREDPNVILIGEMRDPETIAAALTIAETGHLVFATLHTNDAASTVNRILDSFPPHQQPQARSQLSMTLRAVISQILLPHASGTGRVLGSELLIVTPAVQNLIREQKVEQIYLAMQTGGKVGMQTMNQSLYELYARRLITYQTALENTLDPEDLKRLLPKTTPHG